MRRSLPHLAGLVIFWVLFVGFSSATEISHGPMLGHVTHDSIRIWARTVQPGEFVIDYVPATGAPDWSRAMTTAPIPTALADDSTGWMEVAGLKANTSYAYRVRGVGGTREVDGTFHTLPRAEDFANDAYNRRGLFNYRFEYGSCASQNPAN